MHNGISKTFGALVLAAAATTPALAQLSVPNPMPSPIKLYQEPLNGQKNPTPEHFIEVPDTTVTLTGCTNDNHRILVHANIFIDTDELKKDKNGNPVIPPLNKFVRHAESVFKKAAARISSSNYEFGDFGSGNTYLDQTLTQYTRDAKASTGATPGVTTVIYPRIGEMTPGCK